MKNYLILIFVAMMVYGFFGCNQGNNVGDNDSYAKEILSWQEKRSNSLTSSNGWLTLAGLYWLNDGINTFGSSASNDIVFPEGKADTTMGHFNLANDRVTMIINPNTKVFHDSTLVDSILMVSDAGNKPTICRHNTLSWYIIKRNHRYGVRLKDSVSKTRINFKGLEYYPVDSNWRVFADYRLYDPPKTLLIPTEIGTIDTSYCPGILSFTKDGVTFSLEPVSEKDADYLFIIFSDLTSGVETYGGGRFLYTTIPDSGNLVVLDFNKAYNPPCAFTEYATCPLPPEQNKLKIAVKAGEKMYDK